MVIIEILSFNGFENKNFIKLEIGMYIFVT